MSLNLKDPDLFRTRCYVDGQWIDADVYQAHLPFIGN